MNIHEGLSRVVQSRQNKAITKKEELIKSRTYKKTLRLLFNNT